MDAGRLISFEGLDGAGKTTQIELLGNWLDRQQIRYLRTREPGGTPLGVEIRQLLLHRPELEITPLAEALLFQADRAQHFARVVLPALEAGTLVITDRCLDASIAYQGFARGVGVELVERLSLLATRGRLPDLTILLDLDPGQVHLRTGVMERVSRSPEERRVWSAFQSPAPTNDQRGLRDEQTRFDMEAETFHRRVQEGFRLLAHAHPERIKVVDASGTPQQIHENIVKLVESLIRG